MYALFKLAMNMVLKYGDFVFNQEQQRQSEYPK
jgi:hypothetical protein